VDVPFQYLTFFMDDDKRLAEIAEGYKTGKILTGEVKKELTEVMVNLVQRHQRARAAVTDDVIDAFMAQRQLHF
jgi:tryptophanyl-tRNA synthetase